MLSDARGLEVMVRKAEVVWWLVWDRTDKPESKGRVAKSINFNRGHCNALEASLWDLFEWG